MCPSSTGAERIPTSMYQAPQTACSILQRFAVVCCAASPGGYRHPGEVAQQTAANCCKQFAANGAGRRLPISGIR
eukprot:9050777-Alexandrium_andersonii.AAC.1